MNSFTVAVIGAGQLARMMQEAASTLNIDLRLVAEDASASAAQVIPWQVVGQPDDAAAVRRAISDGAVLTFEHEHQHDDLLAELQSEGVSVQPSPAALLYARDKWAMRERLTEIGVPIPRWRQIESGADLEVFIAECGGKCIVKTTRGGYDGKGVRVVADPRECADWLEADGVELIAEEKVDFTAEVAALCARRPSGQVAHWPLVETIQQDGVCAQVIAPAPDAPALATQAREIAETIATELGVTGVLAVEMFVVQGRLLVNELAMRPHNSGHWTIEGSVTSQFEQHLRAVLDLPLGATDLVAPHAVMVNLLGCAHADPRAGYAAVMHEFPEAKLHLYGKSVRPGRKLGHITFLGEDAAQISARAQAAVAVWKGES